MTQICLKVTSINSVPGEFYASYSQTPYNSNGEDAFNISHELLTTIGYKQSQSVSIMIVEQANPLERVYVTPLTANDLDLLVSNKKYFILVLLLNLLIHVYNNL